ncbi:hypothetical protein PS619_03014 [Pseudomonas fluorescens]|nr:hypothetical protein PS619_03014 [Pseudomonas fluorescens]
MTDKNESAKPAPGQDGIQTNGYIPQRPTSQAVTKPVAPPPKQP